jgi:hypothetical protein
LSIVDCRLRIEVGRGRAFSSRQFAIRNRQLTVSIELTLHRIRRRVMMFCRDVDLLFWEPRVAIDAAFASQTLAGGTGDLDGALLSTTGGPSFIDQQVAPGQLIALSGSAAGCFAVTAVMAHALAISSVYDELFPESGSPPTAVGPLTASGATYAVRTFWAQRQVVSDLLLQSVGIVPGTAAALTASVLNPQALRRACTLGSLQMIYSAVAAAASEPAAFNLRADMYARLYRRALLAAQVDLDLDGDGRADARRSPGLVRLVRG